jgi:uncharacterized damage-inducible protein DinB
MDPLKTYDYLTRARARIFDWIRPLGAEAWTRELPGWGWSLGRTLTHVMVSEWYYMQRMLRRDVPPYEEWPIREESPPPFPELEAMWSAQAVRTRQGLASVRDWTARFEYRVVQDDGRPVIVTASAGDLCTQLALHEVHHRAQAVNMLRRLGATPEDLDFNAMTFDRRPAPGT